MGIVALWGSMLVARAERVPGEQDAQKPATDVPTVTKEDAEGVPTFTKDVAPILYKNCASCHRPGEIGPMPLISYEDARPWAKAIRDEVSEGHMPPWHADPKHGRFQNDRSLSTADRETLVKWANGGAPKGDAKDMPELPKFTDGWSIGTPDLVVSMPQPYKVPADGFVEYQVHRNPRRSEGRQMDSGNGGASGQSRGRAPRDRLCTAAPARTAPDGLPNGRGNGTTAGRERRIQRS